MTKCCNLNCLHCYNASGNFDLNGEATLSEAEKIVDCLSENKTRSINFGTGESGLSPVFWKILPYIKEKGITVGLTTNGWSVNNKTITTIGEYVNDVDVSIDFSEPNRHNQFRGSKKAWSWATNALDLLKDNGIKHSIVTAVTALNYEPKVLAGICAIANKYEANFRINWFRPTGRGKLNSYLKLNDHQIITAFKWLLKNTTLLALPDPLFSALIGLNCRKGCPCGSASFRITPEKKVVPCVYMSKETSGPDIMASSMTDILNSNIFSELRNRKPEQCLNCKFWEYCRGGCASRACLENGIINSPDGFCFLQRGLNNPFDGIDYAVSASKDLVHENYLCTMIMEPNRT